MATNPFAKDPPSANAAFGLGQTESLDDSERNVGTEKKPWEVAPNTEEDQERLEPEEPKVVDESTKDYMPDEAKELLKKAEEIKAKHGGNISDIPYYDEYWGLMNQIRALVDKSKHL